METITIGILTGATIVVIGVGIWLKRKYNELVWNLEKVNKITGNLDAVLKNKFDLIPSLIDVVKGYVKHESSTFTEVTRLRSQWGEAKNPADKIKSANQLESALSKLLVVQERYPQLKANRSFQNIMKSINYAEGKVLKERMYYNEVVRRYNIRTKLFPINIVAKLFGFKEREYFSIEKEK